MQTAHQHFLVLTNTLFSYLHCKGKGIFSIPIEKKAEIRKLRRLFDLCQKEATNISAKFPFYTPQDAEACVEVTDYAVNCIHKGCQGEPLGRCPAPTTHRIFSCQRKRA